MKNNFNNANPIGSNGVNAYTNQAQTNAPVHNAPEVLPSVVLVPSQTSQVQPQMQAPQQQFPVANANVIPHPQFSTHYVGDIASAGLSEKQAQTLNFLYRAACIRNNEHFGKKFIDFQFEVQRQELLKNSDSQSSFPMGNGATSSGNRATLDRNMVNDFIKLHEAVHLDRTYGSASNYIWIRDKSTIRHIITSEADFCIEFEDYIFDKFPAYEEIPQTVIQRLTRMLLHSIPKLSASGLEGISENNVVFPNGVYDLKSGIFLERTMAGIFNRFSLLYNFNGYAPNPDNFDMILSDISGGNSDIVTRAYEIIGALISPIARLKLIFVFQGASHGGKTKLAELICLLLNEFGVRVVNDISEITSEIKLEEGLQTQLMYMQDAPDKKITAKQASFLKTFSGGNTLNQSEKFKLLICTNGALHTGDGDYLPQSLLNRLTVLPFPKAMSLDFDEYRENCFEQERIGIVKKSLEAFHRVLTSGGKFSGDFSINECIETQISPAELSLDELSRLNTTVSEAKAKPMKPKLDKVLDELFTITENINEDMNAQNILIMINKILPQEVKNVATLGRRLANHFGERLHSEKIGQKICYNLVFRESNG